VSTEFDAPIGDRQALTVNDAYKRHGRVTSKSRCFLALIAASFQNDNNLQSHKRLSEEETTKCRPARHAYPRSEMAFSDLFAGASRWRSVPTLGMHGMVIPGTTEAAQTRRSRPCF